LHRFGRVRECLRGMPAVFERTPAYRRRLTQTVEPARWLW
jgi:hypothetical protein